MYQHYLQLLFKAELTPEELQHYCELIFVLAETKNGSILPLVKCIQGSEIGIDEINDIIIKIIFYEPTRREHDFEENLEEHVERYIEDEQIDITLEMTKKVEKEESQGIRMKTLKLLTKSVSRIEVMKERLKKRRPLQMSS